jgi:hypothetical protein
MKEINAKDILQSFRSDMPKDSKTARAIDAGADIEEISACASSEGLHALAGALFGLLEEGGLQSGGGQAGASSTPVLEGLGNRIREFRKQLPNGSKTAAKIDQKATLEEISECAEEEGLFSFAAMLAEAEQEFLGKPKVPA